MIQRLGMYIGKIMARENQKVYLVSTMFEHDAIHE